MTPARVLVVDDEPQLRRVIRATLAAAGYETEGARTGEEALDKLRQFRPDLVLLDMNMPGMGGLAACRAMRLETGVAIIMLTVRDAEDDKVRALDAGADDFVTKPFSTPELMARIRAALRRVAPPPAGRVRVRDLVIDFGARTVTQRAKTVHLTPKELELLRYLTQHSNETVAHSTLLQRVWGSEYVDQVDYLRVFIRSLRRKIEPNPEEPEYITTEPWVGYRLNGTPGPA